MINLGLKVGDRVNIITKHGVEVGKIEHGVVIKIYKNGIYKVLSDSRKYDNYCYKFRPNGEQCGTNWKNYTYLIIEKELK